MRRAFILIPVLIFSLAASVVPCGAQLFGVPDDVPARRIIVPFFDIEVDGTDDFLIVLVNTFNKDIDLHLVLYDRDTSHVYNDTRTMTAGDVELIGVRDLTLGPIPSGALSRLVVEENGKSYYRGEIFIDVQDPVLEPGESDPFVNNQGNVLLGYIYRIDVAQGTLSECNALHVQKGATSVIERFEYIETDPETAEEVTKNYIFDSEGLERFTANALAVIDDWIRTGQLPQAGPIPPITGNSFEFGFRYFIPSTENSEAYLIVWNEYPDEDHSLSFYVFDEYENAISSGVDVPHQVNIFRLSEYIPAGFVNPDNHRAGWVRVFTDGRASLMWVVEHLDVPGGPSMDGMRMVPRSLQ